MNYQKIISTYLANRKAVEDKRKTIEAMKEKRLKQIERLDKKAGKLGYVYWKDNILILEIEKRTKRYSKGTIGELNGGNIVCIDVPKNASIDWFVKHLSTN